MADRPLPLAASFSLIANESSSYSAPPFEVASVEADDVCYALDLDGNRNIC